MPKLNVKYSTTETMLKSAARLCTEPGMVGERGAFSGEPSEDAERGTRRFIGPLMYKSKMNAGRIISSNAFGDLSHVPLPREAKSRNLFPVYKSGSARKPSVCLLAFHPLVLSEFERFLTGHPVSVQSKRLEPDVIADPGKLNFPKASVYAVETHPHNPTTEALVLAALGAHPGARVIVVAEKFDQLTAFPLLRLGAKGLLTFSEASEQLARAIQEVAKGGFWVPRTLLSRFVDETLSAVRRPRGTASGARLSRREKEVLDALLENLSNKEIASRLNMSERTAKFHVSNLLAKYGVRRRADLILLTLTQLDRPA